MPEAPPAGSPNFKPVLSLPFWSSPVFWAFTTLQVTVWTVASEGVILAARVPKRDSPMMAFPFSSKVFTPLMVIFAALKESFVEGFFTVTVMVLLTS